MNVRTFFAISIFLITNILQAQHIISNKGNRNQTYPNVTAVNPQIADLVEQVSMGHLESSIRWMQELGNRNACSDGALQTQNWLMDKFESYGLEVFVHYFPAIATGNNCTVGDTIAAGNVVAIQWGTEFDDEYIMIVSHYDHPGPGADDNASGTAGVLEIARILSQHSFKRTIVYVPFNAEEYWMWGSTPFVEKCAQEELNILGVFNLDMIGYFPEDVGALAMYFGTSKISDRLGEYYKVVANKYVSIPTNRFTVGDCYGGDHMPFNIYEYPALFIGDIEYMSVHPCYHRPCDTLGGGVNSLPLAQGFVRATLAAVVELADGWLPPQNLSAVPSDSEITVSWDAAPETASYKLFKNNILLTETTETFYVDTKVVLGTEYMYYVKGVRTGSGEESSESNRDKIAISPPLSLPYFNDFEANTDGWKTDPEWERITSEHYSGSSCLTTGSILQNHFSIAELRRFSIPDTATNVALSFYFKGAVRGHYYAEYESNVFIEVSTDRKRWDKLVKISGTFNNWTFCQVPLNQYIGEPFVQVRIRAESSGEEKGKVVGKLYFDDIGINFTAITKPIPENLKVISYSENPPKTVLEWDKVTVPVRGYNIYRNNIKINVNLISGATYTDVNSASPNNCYRATAVYFGAESDFSNEICIKDVGIKENLPFSAVKIIPNPSTGNINIETGLSVVYHLAIYTMQGIKVFERESFTDGALDVSTLPKGMYILKITTRDDSVAKKIVIQ
ncbi:MAG: M28 family peptidase [Bacteroidales bacterium]|nr:M28 family peptidase [Bacteroidales bacterium]